MQISQKYMPKGPINSKQALTFILTWNYKEDKPLSEPIPAQWSDAYLWHLDKIILHYLYSLTVNVIVM